MLETCTDEELKQFAEMSAWCFKNKHRIKTRPDELSHREDSMRGFLITIKPRKNRPTSIELQAQRRAIDRLVWQKDSDL